MCVQPYPKETENKTMNNYIHLFATILAYVQMTKLARKRAIKVYERLVTKTSWEVAMKTSKEVFLETFTANQVREAAKWYRKGIRMALQRGEGLLALQTAEALYQLERESGLPLMGAYKVYWSEDRVSYLAINDRRVVFNFYGRIVIKTWEEADLSRRLHKKDRRARQLKAEDDREVIKEALLNGEKVECSYGYFGFGSSRADVDLVLKSMGLNLDDLVVEGPEWDQKAYFGPTYQVKAYDEPYPGERVRRESRNAVAA